MLSFPILAAVILLHAAQDPDAPRALNLKRVPAAGPQPSSFVPSGWQIEKQLTVDLNADQRPDRVLQLLEKKIAGQENSGDERALVTILAQPDGTWKRVGASNKVVYCKSCFGALSGPEGGIPDVSVKKGVVIVYQTGGSREAWNSTTRFRYEPSSNRMRLIGTDEVVVDRATGDIETTSTNLLTGIQEVSKGRIDQDKSKKTRRSLKPPKRYLDDFNPEEVWK
ncbi:hypothetical protein [Hymenobacter sp. GOD-10R]|uniref:hypothetical protein n=1 Tax=Hymenobacter sp. GOD-10R TaxID=3093922 RepID=UPI002D764D9F|nr:hypothetical protein [Hymenobacter sp. GOD-10R]WRQ27256.1 hypothetical protein SD425_19475 [Hymenobacter sp. GOD-10R]